MPAVTPGTPTERCPIALAWSSTSYIPLPVTAWPMTRNVSALASLWCAMTVVDGDAATLGGDVDDHLTVPGDGRASRFDHVEAETSGDGGVNRVSAALEDVDADLCGDGVSGGDGAVLDDDFVFVGSPDAMGVHKFKSPTNAI